MLSRTALFVPLAFFAGTGILAAACTTSGTLPTPDASAYAGGDGGLLVLDGQIVLPGYACAFEELAQYSCPGVTLAPPSWQARCVDGDDCSDRKNTTSTVAGCSETATYQNVTPLSETCAAWADSGATLPVIDSGPVPGCAPGSTASFKPTWHPPRTPSAVCSAAQIDGFLQCLEDSSVVYSPASCSGWIPTTSTANQGCINCLESNVSDDEYGPLVFLPTETLVNTSGCLALAEGKDDGTGCGGSLSALQECNRAACLPTCPTGTTSENAAETACEANAQTGVCTTYATPAECAGAIQEGDAGTPAERSCFGLPSGTAAATLQAVATAFCGGG